MRSPNTPLRTGFIVLLCALLAVAMLPTAAADVAFDDFQVSLVDDDIETGDDFEIELTFENPDQNDTVDVELEILVDGVTVYLDEAYSITFEDGVDKVITFDSGDFPGPDLDHDYYNENLMNYQCDTLEIEVRVTGSDLDVDVEDTDDLAIGDDAEDLSFDMDPSEPTLAEEVTVHVQDDSGDDLDDASVKVTWIDDPDGDEDGEWDSDDGEWEDETDTDGEAFFTIEDEFDGEAEGEFQIDVYKDGFCLARDTFDISNELLVEVTPSNVEAGESFTICVTDGAGQDINNAEVYVSGPGYAKRYYTRSDGCTSLSINTVGTYSFSVSESGYETNTDAQVIVERRATTSTTSAPPTTTSSIRLTTSTIAEPTDKELVISFTPTDPTEDEAVAITTEDAAGDPVEGVSVTVSPEEVSGTTDAEGIYTFTPSTAGMHQITAEKEGYEPVTDYLDVAPATTGDDNETAVGDEPPEPTDQESSSVTTWLIIVGVLALLVVAALAVFAYLFLKQGKPGGGTSLGGD